MSLYDYQESVRLSQGDPPFAALLFSLMRKASSGNLDMIRASWPAEYDEFVARYHAPGGMLPNELKAAEARYVDETRTKDERKVTAAARNIRIMRQSRIDFEERPEALLFRVPGKPWVDFYQSTGRWRKVGKMAGDTVYKGGAKAFLEWFELQSE